MSFRAMLKHRCNILRLEETHVNGMSISTYETKYANVRCFLDLTFIRRGKDPQWTPEAGRPADRSGVWFGLPDVDIRSGDQIQMVFGPLGTFQVQGALDDAWKPTKLHHLEYGVVEVPSAIAGVVRG